MTVENLINIVRPGRQLTTAQSRAVCAQLERIPAMERTLAAKDRDFTKLSIAYTAAIEAAAGVMAARERMMDTGDGDAALVQGLARLGVLLDMAALPGVGVCAAPCEADADAWVNPGLTLARLIVAASWYLRGRRSASELCQAAADARSAVQRVALPRRADVAVAREGFLELL